jgi:hypothetical protein
MWVIGYEVSFTDGTSRFNPLAIDTYAKCQKMKSQTEQINAELKTHRPTVNLEWEIKPIYEVPVGELEKLYDFKSAMLSAAPAV